MFSLSLISRFEALLWRDVTANEVLEPCAKSSTSACYDLERRDQPVAQEDLEILIRADELLADKSKWNRKDDRNCKDDESADRRSLYCALQKACIEVLGAYDHRRVALQDVRFAIVDVTGVQKFAGLLRDYNNLPETKFDDVKQVLKVARENVSVRLANPEN